MKEVIGILVSFNPDIQQLIDNVKLISVQVDKLVIVDNNSSNKDQLNHLKSIPNVEIIFNENNVGLGKAYNIALNKYYRQYKSFVTFDQDTKIVANTIKTLYNQLFSNDRIGVVGPSFSRKVASIAKGNLIDKLVVIQSCAIFKMKIYSKIGGFNEEYFIDSIDFEYCLRIKNIGYLVKMYNGVNIQHELGEIEKFGNKTVIVHSNLRNYYMSRNHFKLIRTYFFKFPLFCLKLHFFFLKHIFQVKFIEKNNEKMRFIKKGFLNVKL